MADPKAKVSKGAPTAAKGGASKSSFSPKLTQIISKLTCTSDELSDQLDNLADIEKVHEDKKALEKQLEQKNQELEGLKESTSVEKQKLETELKKEKDKYRAIFEGFEERAVTYLKNQADWREAQSNLEDAEKDSSALKKELETAKKAQANLRTRAAKAERELGQELDSRNKAQIELNVASSHLATSKAELAKIEADFNNLRREIGEDQFQEFNDERRDLIEQELGALFLQGRKLLERFVKTNATNESDLRFFTQLFPKSQRSKLPLSTSDSQHAAHVRLDVAQSILAKSLVDLVFRPFLMPQDVEEALLGSVSSLRRRSIIRRQMLLSFDKGSQARQNLSREAAEDTHKRLLNIIEEPSACNTELIKFFEDALDVWSKVYSPDEIFLGEALTSEDDEAEDDEAPLRSSDLDSSTAVMNGGSAASPSTGGEIIAMLFPRIASESCIIHPGVAMRSNDPAVVAAKKEINSSPRTNGIGKTPGQQPPLNSSRRRLSISTRSP